MAEMDGSRDVDKMVSDFLSELNDLSDSLEGAARDAAGQTRRASAPDVLVPEAPQDAQTQAAAGSAGEEAKPGDASQPATRPLPYRNIDILLMDDVAPPPSIDKAEDDRFPHSFKAMHDTQTLRLRRAEQRRARVLAWASASAALLCLLNLLYWVDPFGLARSKTAPPSPPQGAPAPGQGSVGPAVAIDKIVPTYPSRARRLGIGGVVDVRADVDERGKVVRAVAVRGPSMLRPAAARAVARCRFKPAHRDGTNLRSTITVSVPFNP